ncbi:23426_t:CDS:1, partial [Racocetra persica]
EKKRNWVDRGNGAFHNVRRDNLYCTYKIDHNISDRRHYPIIESTRSITVTTHTLLSVCTI